MTARRGRLAITAAHRPYLPQGAALDLFYTRAPEVLMEGPAGTGKSRALLEKVNFCAVRYPDMRGLLVRKTRESMTESVLVTFEEKVIPPGWPILAGPSRRLRQTYQYPNGSCLVIGGIDRSSRIMSTEYDLILAFEARELSEDDWESLTSRLRNHRMPYQQAIADTNPDLPTHWLNVRAQAGRMLRLLSRHQDNPMVTSEYLARLASLSGVRYQRLCKGLWAGGEDLVYEDFDPALHVVDRFEVPADWRRIRAIDFGYTNPFVCQWWAIDGDGRMWLYRELYQTRLLLDVAAERILALTGNEAIAATVTDHDPQLRATLGQHGIATIPAFKSIRPGLQAVTARLQRGGDGRVRLALLRDSLVERDPHLRDAGRPCCTEQEFAAYCWPDHGSGRPRDGELPAPGADHGLDALRYAVAYVDQIDRAGADLSVRVVE